MFSHFFLVLILKILAFFAQKTEILAKKWFFLAFLVKIFKNKICQHNPAAVELAGQYVHFTGMCAHIVGIGPT